MARLRIPRANLFLLYHAASVVRFLRLQLNFYLFVRLGASRFERLPAAWKDGRGLLLRRFHVNGALFFVQVGSNDGIRRDPIHRFIMRHRWSGIMLEPVPAIFDALISNCRGNPNLHFENVAIAEARGTLAFYSIAPEVETLPEWHDQIGSLLPETLLRYGHAIPDIEKHIVEQNVPAITYADLMAQYQEPDVDFLHIDAEGYDHRILRSIDFAKHGPPMILYENVILSVDERADCKTLLQDAGYTLIDQAADTFAYRAEVLFAS